MALLVSGCLLTPTSLSLHLDWEVPWRLVGGQRLLAVALHSGSAFLMAMMLGGLLAIHVRLGWRHGGNTVSGILLLLVQAGLILTALGIFYFGNEDWARLAALAHLLLGALLVLPFLYHFLRGRGLARYRHEHLRH